MAKPWSEATDSEKANAVVGVVSLVGAVAFGIVGLLTGYMPAVGFSITLAIIAHACGVSLDSTRTSEGHGCSG